MLLTSPPEPGFFNAKAQSSDTKAVVAIVSALALMSGYLLHADLKPHCMSTVSIPPGAALG